MIKLNLDFDDDSIYSEIDFKADPLNARAAC